MKILANSFISKAPEISGDFWTILNGKWQHKLKANFTTFEQNWRKIGLLFILTSGNIVLNLPTLVAIDVTCPKSTEKDLFFSLVTGKFSLNKFVKVKTYSNFCQENLLCNV